MNKHEQFIPGKHAGTDLGNPGLDVLGDEVDRDTFPTPVIDRLVRFNESTKASLKRRDAQRPGLARRVVAGGAATVAAAGLAYGAITSGGNEGQPQPKAENIPVTTVVNGHEARTVVPASEATPAQLNAQISLENGGPPVEVP